MSAANEEIHNFGNILFVIFFRKLRKLRFFKLWDRKCLDALCIYPFTINCLGITSYLTNARFAD